MDDKTKLSEKLKENAKLRYLASELFELWEDLATDGELVSTDQFIRKYLDNCEKIKDLFSDRL